MSATNVVWHRQYVTISLRDHKPVSSLPCPFSPQIHLPMSIEAARALPAAVWQTFWADLVGSGLSELLNAYQHDLIQDLILMFRYFNAPLPQATAMWPAFIEQLQSAAEAGAQFDTPGEEILYDLALWEKSCIPVSALLLVPGILTDCIRTHSLRPSVISPVTQTSPRPMQSLAMSSWTTLSPRTAKLRTPLRLLDV